MKRSAAADSQLANVLGIRPGDVVAAIGGGGKTTLLEMLATELASRGDAVIFTTTTKIWPRAGAAALEPGPTWPPDPAPGEVVTAASQIGDDGKLHGLAPEAVCTLRSDGRVVLCEADGSAGRPLKVHGPGEPVVPPCTTLTLCIAGLDSLNHPIDGTTVHRLERWDSVIGRRKAIVTTRILADILRAAACYVPKESRLVFVLNKAAGKTGSAGDIAHHLRGLGDMLIATEWGKPLASGTFEL